MTPEVLSTRAPVQMLRLAQVCKVTGLGRSMIYQLEAERRFPSRIKLGTRAVGWIEEEVQAWLARRIESSRGELLDVSVPSGYGHDGPPRSQAASGSNVPERVRRTP